jgi:protein-tyrosine-phosphatase
VAEGLLPNFGIDHFEVPSGGAHPACLNADAITVMREIGADISRQRSKPVDDFIGQNFDFVITVCDRVRNGRIFLWPHRLEIHSGSGTGLAMVCG